MAARKSTSIYQFKITLQGITPPIWRRIQVPDNYSFWDLHVAIQCAMGWTDSHLHQFEVKNPLTRERVIIGMDDLDMDWVEVLPEHKTKLSSCFSLTHKHALYEYDFGDGWEHKVTLEKILPREPAVTYPRCIAGKRACPSEDCGGVYGYLSYLEILQQPGHEEYASLVQWIGENFDPEVFDPKDVVFEDPKEWWQATQEDAA